MQKTEDSDWTSLSMKRQVKNIYINLKKDKNKKYLSYMRIVMMSHSSFKREGQKEWEADTMGFPDQTVQCRPPHDDDELWLPTTVALWNQLRVHRSRLSDKYYLHGISDKRSKRKKTIQPLRTDQARKLRGNVSERNSTHLG